MLVVESFLRSLVKVYGTHTAVYSDCGGTWYHEARSSLGLKHRLHTCSEKGQIERERFSIPKTGQRILMITILVLNRDYVTYRMYTNGYVYLYLCIMQ